MAVEFKDYYEILGINREAGDEEIRRAFRQLARLYHPDKTGNDRFAEDKFKEINEAYEVLGDPARRKRYDEFQATWRRDSSEEAWREFFRAGTPPSQTGRSGHFTFTSSGFSEFFDNLFARRSSPSDSGGRFESGDAFDSSEEEVPGGDLESDIWLSLEEIAHGAVRPVAIRRAARCETCFGVGRYNGRRCERCDGAGAITRSDLFHLKIPKGAPEGSLLRVPQRGEEGAARAQPGDLYLKVHYARHPDFRMLDGQLCHDLELAPWEAVLGAIVSIPTLEGSAALRIPPGTQNGQKLRVKGRGLPSADGTAGDLIVAIHVQVPSAAPPRERQLWEELARESNYNPRHN